MDRRPPAFAPLPRGARDLLPETCRRWRGLKGTLLEHFEAWGYREVRPPAIEYFEVIGRGLDADVRERSLRFGEEGSGRVVALRADVTPQIARMVAQRVGGSILPGDQVRLCYEADTIAAPQNAMDRAERHQVGVELLGEVAPHGDAELIALADEALGAVGCTQHRFDLGDTQIVRRALSQLPLALRDDVRFALARKDNTAMAEQLAAVDGLDAALRDALMALGHLFGEPHSTLERARTELAALDVGAELDRLDEVLAALARIAPETLERVELDLGEARGHEYYTGLRVRVWAPGTSSPVIRGGRYDDLLAGYGAEMPASGFALDLDALERALRHAGVDVGVGLAPARVVGLDRAFASASARALVTRLASQLRAAGGRAWVEVSDSQARAQARAVETGASDMLWFGGTSPSESDADDLDATYFRADAAGNWSRADIPAPLASAVAEARAQRGQSA